MKKNTKKVSDLELQQINGGQNTGGYNADCDFTIIEKCPFCNGDVIYSAEPYSNIDDQNNPKVCKVCGKPIASE